MYSFARKFDKIIMETWGYRVAKEIEEIKKKIEQAEVERKTAREKLKSIPEGQPTSRWGKLLDSASQELHDLREMELKLIERQTTLDTATSVIPLKRTHSKTSRSSGGERSQESFRARILTRDTQGCILTVKKKRIVMPAILYLGHTFRKMIWWGKRFGTQCSPTVVTILTTA